MIIAIVNSKGGVGKSTLSVHLAAWLHEQGYSVILADCDTQQSSSQWIHEVNPEIKTVRLNNQNEIANVLPELRKEADFVIADGPGGDSDTSRMLLMCADFAVVPCKASMLEIRALSEATEVLRQARAMRQGVPDAMIVLSMIRKNYRLTQDMRDAAVALKLPVATASMTLRQDYADAPGQRVVVWQLRSRARDAASEVRRLIHEIMNAACKTEFTSSSKKRGAKKA